MSKAARKALDEARETGNPELDLQEKQITSLEDLPGLCKWRENRVFLTRCIIGFALFPFLAPSARSYFISSSFYEVVVW